MDTISMDIDVFADIVESLWEHERFTTMKAKEGFEKQKGKFNSDWLYSSCEICRIGAYAWSYISEDDRQKLKKHFTKVT